MCQTNNIQKRFTVGTICYKVLQYSHVDGYCSLYQAKLWRLGQTYKTAFYNHKLSSDIVKEYCSPLGGIGPGFFHAFPTLEEAIKFQERICGKQFTSIFRDHVVTKYPIAEMRIPENVDGFSGIYLDYNEPFSSIVVPILEFVKIVDQNVLI